jgi:hypothetical protein
MPDSRDQAPRWRTSSRSNGAACLQVQVHPSVVRIRDSKDPDGPVLVVGATAFREFLAGVRGGEFDLPE